MFNDPKAHNIDTYTLITTLEILLDLCHCLYNSSNKESFCYGIDQEMDPIEPPSDVSIISKIPFLALFNLSLKDYSTNTLFIIKVFKLARFLVEYRTRYFSSLKILMNGISGFVINDFPFFNREYKGVVDGFLKAVSVAVCEDQNIGVCPLEKCIVSVDGFADIITRASVFK